MGVYNIMITIIVVRVPPYGIYFNFIFFVWITVSQYIILTYKNDQSRFYLLANKSNNGKPSKRTSSQFDQRNLSEVQKIVSNNNQTLKK